MRHGHHPLRRDISKLSYLKHDVINAAYLVQPPAKSPSSAWEAS